MGNLRDSDHQDNDDQHDSRQPEESPLGKNAPPPALKQVVLSTLAAAIGIQSNKNRERDFNSTSPIHYMIAGIVFVVVFVSGLVALAHFLVTSQA